MNKKVIILTIFIILGMISFATIYKINKDHQNNSILVVEKEFKYQAEKCFYDAKCQKVVTLKELYEYKYLKEKLTNPITKKYYEETSNINLETNKIELIS